jgi:hypothetical protein
MHGLQPEEKQPLASRANRRVMVVDVSAEVRKFRHTPSGKRRALLQDLIGAPTGDSGELQFRAELLTELGRERLWPLVREGYPPETEDDGA